MNKRVLKHLSLTYVGEEDFCSPSKEVYKGKQGRWLFIVTRDEDDNVTVYRSLKSNNIPRLRKCGKTCYF